MKWKQWICEGCGRRGETKPEIIIKFCVACTSIMKEVKEDGRFNKS